MNRRDRDESARSRRRQHVRHQDQGHIRGNLNVGNTRPGLLDLITQLLPWVGYPRTLNALSCLNEVAPER